MRLMTTTLLIGSAPSLKATPSNLVPRATAVLKVHNSVYRWGAFHCRSRLMMSYGLVSLYIFFLNPLIGPLQDFVMSVHLLLPIGLGLIIDCTA